MLIEDKDLKQIIDILKAYDVVADKFIAKVESGRASSIETYRELKSVREKSKMYRESGCCGDG